MTAKKIKLNTKRADACRPATSALRKQSLHTEEEEGGPLSENTRQLSYLRAKPAHKLYLLDNTD